MNTSTLPEGVHVGKIGASVVIDDLFFWVGYHGTRILDDKREEWSWKVLDYEFDLETVIESDENTRICGGVNEDCKPEKMLATFASFLSAWCEADDERYENYDLFDNKKRHHIDKYREELSMLVVELEDHINAQREI